MQLKALYPKLTTQQRRTLASRAAVDEGYLWQIATGWRGKRPSIALIQRLAAADRRLKVSDLVAEFASPTVATAKEPAHA